MGKEKMKRFRVTWVESVLMEDFVDVESEYDAVGAVIEQDSGIPIKTLQGMEELEIEEVEQ